MTKISASDKKIFAAAAAMLVVLLLAMTVAFSRLREFDSSNQWNIHTYQVLSKLQETQTELDNLETLAGSFLREERFKAPYEKQKKEFSTAYRAVVKLTGDNAGQQQRLKTAKKQFEAWLAIFNPTVAVRRANGPADPRLRAAQEPLRQRMDAIRITLFGVRDVEQKLLQQRKQQRQLDQDIFRSTILTNMGLAVLFVGALAAGLARSARQIEKSNTELRHEMEQRQRAERESQVLYQHNEQILNSTTEGIIGLNLKGRITFVNPAAAHTTGWDISELIGKSLHDFIHHTRADGTRYAKEASPILASLQDGRVRRVIDEVFWRREGRSFPVEYTVTPLWESSDNNPSPEGNDTLVGAAVTFRDITERKRSEIALLRLASIVESSKDAILSHTMDGSIVSCNAAAVRMYGYSARELEGQALEVLFPRSRAEELLFVTQAIAQGERIEPYQTTLLQKNGSPLDVAVTFYPVKDAAGNIVGASSNARPIRRQAGVTVNLPSFPFNGSSRSNGRAVHDLEEAETSTA